MAETPLAEFSVKQGLSPTTLRRSNLTGSVEHELMAWLERSIRQMFVQHFPITFNIGQRVCARKGMNPWKWERTIPLMSEMRTCATSSTIRKRLIAEVL